MNSAKASPHVIFSMRSVDRAAPNIWLAPDPPNVESSPPPFGFWMSTTSINMIQIRATNMVKRVIIALLALRFERQRKNFFGDISILASRTSLLLPHYGPD